MVKLGLGDSYEKTIIPPKIRAYGDLTKPASSIGVMITIPFAAIIHAELNGLNGLQFLVDNYITVIYASVTMLLLHGGSQAMNMAEDAHIDKQTPHKQNRPIPAGIVSAEEARSIAWIFIFVGVARAFTINSQFGLMAVILAFFGVFYNLEPIRAKKILWVNLGWQAASRGLFLFPATFAVWGEMFTLTPWVMGVISFMLVLSMQNTADFPDVELDEEYGIITPAVRYEFRELVMIMGGIVLVMFSVLSMSIEFELIPNFYLLYLLIIPIGYSLIKLWMNPTETSSISGQSTAWYVFYLSLASMYMIPAIQLLVL